MKNEYRIIGQIVDSYFGGFVVRLCTETERGNCTIKGELDCPCRKKCKDLAYFSAAKHGKEGAFELSLAKVKALNPRGKAATGRANPSLFYSRGTQEAEYFMV